MVDQKIVDHYADMDIDELEFELEDLNNAIKNEEIWSLACLTPDEMDMRMENIKKLQIEAAYVRKLVREAK